MANSSVLIVEDDFYASSAMKDFLQDEGFNVTIVESALEAVQVLYSKTFDLVLLDISLPDYNGLDLCKKIRLDSAIPIIIISAHNEREFKRQAFRFGADDYIVKPADLEELVDRMWVFLRRMSPTGLLRPLEMKKSKSLIINPDTSQLEFDGKILNLTAMERMILLYLYTHKNRVITRSELIDTMQTVTQKRSSIDFHIKNIRKKIGDDASAPKYLKSVYGKGYQFMA
ncbi:MAG: response regulator transcription factor [Sulfuricurvum sp.]